MLWGSLAYFALLPANRAPQALHDMIAGMASGEPGWLAALDNHAASLLAHQGLAASIVLAVALVVIAVGVYLPSPAARATVVLAIVVAAVDLGLRRGLRRHPGRRGTDPNSGLLLILLAAAYWPTRIAVTAPAARTSPGGAAGRSEGMTTPAGSWTSWPAVMLLVAAISAGRLVVARSLARSARDVGHRRRAPADGHRDGRACWSRA